MDAGNPAGEEQGDYPGQFVVADDDPIKQLGDVIKWGAANAPKINPKVRCWACFGSTQLLWFPTAPMPLAPYCPYAPPCTMQDPMTHQSMHLPCVFQRRGPNDVAVQETMDVDDPALGFKGVDMGTGIRRRRRAQLASRLADAAQALGPGGCIGCNTKPCQWKPCLDRAMIQKRLRELEAEKIRVKQLPRSDTWVTTQVLTSTMQGGRSHLPRADMMKELQTEIDAAMNDLKLIELDRELHDVHASRTEFVQTVTLHGVPQMAYRGEAIEALDRAVNKVVATKVAVGVVDDILEWMLEGWLFGERESTMKQAGYVPSVNKEAPIKSTDPDAGVFRARAQRGMGGTGQDGVTNVQAADGLADDELPVGAIMDGDKVMVRAMDPLIYEAARRGDPRVVLSPGQRREAGLEDAEGNPIQPNASQSSKQLQKLLPRQTTPQRPTGGSGSSASSGGGGGGSQLELGDGVRASPGFQDRRAVKDKWQAIEANTLVKHRARKAIEQNKQAMETVDLTENTLRYGLFLMSLQYFRGMSMLMQQKRVWSGSAESGKGGAELTQERKKMTEAERKHQRRQQAIKDASERAEAGFARRAKREQEEAERARLKLRDRVRRRKAELQSAQKIQSVFRGFVARQAVAKWGAKKRERDAKRALFVACAITIQRVWRGYVGREVAKDRARDMAAFIRMVRDQEEKELEEEYYAMHTLARWKRDRFNEKLKKKQIAMRAKKAMRSQQRQDGSDNDDDLSDMSDSTQSIHENFSDIEEDDVLFEELRKQKGRRRSVIDDILEPFENDFSTAVKKERKQRRLSQQSVGAIEAVRGSGSRPSSSRRVAAAIEAAGVGGSTGDSAMFPPALPSARRRAAGDSSARLSRTGPARRSGGQVPEALPSIGGGGGASARSGDPGTARSRASRGTAGSGASSRSKSKKRDRKAKRKA